MPLLPQVALPLVRLLYKFWIDHRVPQGVLDEILAIDLEKENGKKFGISSSKLAQLHTAAAISSNDPLIGIRLGHFLAGAEVTLGNLVKTADHLQQGLEALQRLSTVVSEAGYFEIDNRDEATFIRFVHFPEVPFTAYQYHMIYAAVLDWIAGSYPGLIEQIEFEIDPQQIARAGLEALLPCDINETDGFAIVIPNHLMLFDNPNKDAFVHQQCVKDAEKLAQKRNARLELYRLVRQTIKECLLECRASQEDVAKQLQMSVRNLQRRLKEAGTNYQSILDDSREALAIKLISDDSVPLYEIAFLVGYTEPSAFYKAFKRWTGKRPGDYRASVLARQAAVNEVLSAVE